jgi:predicted metalloprotease
LASAGAPPTVPPSVASAPAAAAAPVADAELDEFVDETVDALNTYWTREFRPLGRTYTPPRLVKAAHNQSIRSECGNSRGSDHSYCQFESTVYVDYDSDDYVSFISLWDEERDLVIVATLGHEWGHHVQNLLGIFDDDSGSVADSRRFELQADCLMGLFVGHYEESSDWVGRGDIRDVIRDTRESGDDPEGPEEERDHGSSEERVAAFRRGYSGADVHACGI